MLKQASTTLSISTRGPGFIDLTGRIEDWVDRIGAREGLLTAFVRHTSASLTIQENADPDVQRDLEAFFERSVREDPALYRHRAEGADDMPAHIRSALTDVQLTIPVQGGRMVLGTWQGVYLFEHRAAPHNRQLVLHYLGD